MKRFSILGIILALFTLPAFAGNKAETVTFGNDSVVAGKKLPAGEYKMTWTGTGENVQVVLVQKTVPRPATATFNATFTAKKNPYVTVTVDSKGGVDTLESIQTHAGDLKPTSSTATGN